MIDYLLPIATLLIFLADLYRARRIDRQSHPLWWYVSWVAVGINCLHAALNIGYFVDNPSWWVRLGMWVVLVWILSISGRYLYLFFRWIKWPKVGILAAITVVGIVFYGVAWGRTALYVKPVEIYSNRLPKSFDGYRIAFFTDLHLGTHVREERELERLVEMINDCQADLVLFGGDLINVRHTELNERAMELLGSIRPRVYSVIGNHDVGTYIRDSLALPFEVSYARLLEQKAQMGWQVLQDTTCYIRRGNDSISLSGFAFDASFKEQRHDRNLPITGAEKGFRGVPTDLYNITLIHLPQHWEEVTERGYGDLTLSGHTHAMQIKLPLGKRCRGLSPARIIYPRWSGRYDQDGHTLYIGDGVGYIGYPMRIGAHPEITLITLRQCK